MASNIRMLQGVDVNFDEQDYHTWLLKIGLYENYCVDYVDEADEANLCTVATQHLSEDVHQH